MWMDELNRWWNCKPTWSTINWELETFTSEKKETKEKKKGKGNFKGSTQFEVCCLKLNYSKSLYSFRYLSYLYFWLKVKLELINMECFGYLKFFKHGLFWFSEIWAWWRRAVSTSSDDKMLREHSILRSFSVNLMQDSKFARSSKLVRAVQTECKLQISESSYNKISEKHKIPKSFETTRLECTSVTAFQHIQHYFSSCNDQTQM